MRSCGRRKLKTYRFKNIRGQMPAFLQLGCIVFIIILNVFAVFSRDINICPEKLRLLLISRIFIESVIGVALASTLLKPLCPTSYYGTEPYRTTRTFHAKDFYIAIAGFLTGILVIMLLAGLNLKPMAVAFGAFYQLVMAFSIGETWSSFRNAPLLAGFVFYTDPRKQNFEKGEEISILLTLKAGRNEIKPFKLKLKTEYVPEKAGDNGGNTTALKTEREISCDESVPPGSEKEFRFRLSAGEGTDESGKVFVKKSVILNLTGRTGRTKAVKIGDFSFSIEKLDIEA